MKCYCCNEENWHIRKDLNPLKEVGICKNCGNMAIMITEEDKPALSEFYRNHYRKEPNILNINFSTNKLNWIKMFLMNFLKERKDMEGLIFADIGAATGYLCDFFKRLGWKVTGTELTRGFRAFSEHFYGIPLTEEITKKHKYDLISFYHTLEHIPDPDNQLMQCRDLLSENGHILVSVPKWLDVLENLAMIGEFNIRNYFHENHINCFTEKSVKNLFFKCGLEVVKEEHLVCGQTYLLKKMDKDKQKNLNIIKENWEEINKNIDKIKKAIDLFKQNKIKEAIDVWYKFPDAHLKWIFDTNRKDPSKQEHLWQELAKKDRDFSQLPKMIMGFGVWFYQNQEYEKAIPCFEKVLNTRPVEDTFIYLGWCLERMGNFPEAMTMFHKASQMNPQKWPEAMNWICHCACQLPTWDERAKEEIKEELFKQANPKIELKE